MRLKDIKQRLEAEKLSIESQTKKEIQKSFTFKELEKGDFVYLSEVDQQTKLLGKTICYFIALEKPKKYMAPEIMLYYGGSPHIIELKLGDDEVFLREPSISDFIDVFYNDGLYDNNIHEFISRPLRWNNIIFPSNLKVEDRCIVAQVLRGTEIIMSVVRRY